MIPNLWAPALIVERADNAYQLEGDGLHTLLHDATNDGGDCIVSLYTGASHITLSTGSATPVTYVSSICA